MNKTSRLESRLLQISVWGALFVTVLGLFWGLAIKSSVILFDGIYSGVSIFLSILSIVALWMVNRPHDNTFQFGRVALEPLIVSLKAIVIIGVCIYGVVTALVLILDGGNTATSSLSGMLYALISMLTCLVVWLYLKSKGADLPDLVQAESEQWMADLVFSTVVLASFCLSFGLSYTDWRAIVPYIDPGMVVAASVFFIRVPVSRLVYSVRELLMMAPSEDLQEDLRTRIDAVAANHRLPNAVIRMAKVGRELAVDITFITPNDFGPVDIGELDNVREELYGSLSEAGFKLYMNIVFTKERRWA
ncbi:cation diffusion facilitator family transporter [Marinobacter sp. V034]|uniref:cation diffusion facilitator family transporter n=1 Tax=Marinobacter sp. V034 TaxID=3459610 RepID=UPI004044B25F